jgi:uncharacterized protein with HEPN domain
MFYDVKKSVWDAWSACQALKTFTTGQTFEVYLADIMLRSAVERQFEILGEALSRVVRVEPSFRDRFPEIGEVIGMRNRIAHRYDGLDDEIIFNTIKDNVPILMVKLAAWLEEAK